MCVFCSFDEFGMDISIRYVVSVGLCMSIMSGLSGVVLSASISRFQYNLLVLFPSMIAGSYL